VKPLNNSFPNLKSSNPPRGNTSHLHVHTTGQHSHTAHSQNPKTDTNTNPTESPYSVKQNSSKTVATQYQTKHQHKQKNNQNNKTTPKNTPNNNPKNAGGGIRTLPLMEISPDTFPFFCK